MTEVEQGKTEEIVVTDKLKEIKVNNEVGILISKQTETKGQEQREKSVADCVKSSVEQPVEMQSKQEPSVNRQCKEKFSKIPEGMAPNAERIANWKKYFKLTASPEELLEKYCELQEKFNNSSPPPSNDWTVNNPLSLASSSQWNNQFADSELKRLITLDVDRLPENPSFYQKYSETITIHLFLYCKKEKRQYLQGMHEICAITLFAIQHPIDSFFIFCSIMDNLNPYYTTEKYLKICSEIQNKYLKHFDVPLQLHLEKLGIEPQVYCTRWLRLLFARELTISNLLDLWERIFQQDPTLKIIEFVAVGMLLFIKNELMSGDYHTVLARLMKYPPIEDVNGFIKRAIELHAKYLQDLSRPKNLSVPVAEVPRIKTSSLVRLPDREKDAKEITSQTSNGILVKDNSIASQIESIAQSLKAFSPALENHVDYVKFKSNVDQLSRIALFLKNSKS